MESSFTWSVGFPRQIPSSSHRLLLDIVDKDTILLSLEEQDRPTTSLLHEEQDCHWVAASMQLVVRFKVAISMLRAA
jgi:hypothetical protein